MSVDYSDLTDGGEFEVVKGEYAPTHDFEENDTLIGIYTGSRSVNTRNGERLVHTVTQDGQPLDFWGTAIINSRLRDVPSGVKIKVVSTGRMIPTQGGRKAKEFEVLVAKGSIAR